MILTISGDPIYLIEGTLDQSLQSKIDSHCEPYDLKLFSKTSPFGLSITTRPPKNPRQILASVSTTIPLQSILFTPPPLSTNDFNSVFNHLSLVVKL